MRKCAKATWIGSHGVWKDRYWDFDFFAEKENVNFGNKIAFPMK